MPRRPRIRPAILAVVVAGATIGVLLRELLLLPFSALAESTVIALPLATMAVNVIGSFAIGAVAGALGTRHPIARAFLGTGVIGGFTTYSAFAVQSASLFSGAPLIGIGLAVIAVLLGLFAAALGVRLTDRPADGDPSGPPVGSGATS